VKWKKIGSYQAEKNTGKHKRKKNRGSVPGEYQVKRQEKQNKRQQETQRKIDDQRLDYRTFVNHGCLSQIHDFPEPAPPVIEVGNMNRNIQRIGYRLHIDIKG